MRLKTDMYTDMRNEIWNDLNLYYKDLTPSPCFAPPDLKEVIVSSLCKAKLLLRIVGDLLYTSWYNGSRQYIYMMPERFTTELNTIFDINTVIGQRRLIRLGLCPYVRISDIREQPDKSIFHITLSYVFLKNDAIVAAPLNMTIDILTKDNGYYDFESDKYIIKNNKLSVRYKLYLSESKESIDLSKWNDNSDIDHVHDLLYEYFYNPVTKLLISTVLLCISSHDCGYLNFCRNCQNNFERNVRCITSLKDIIDRLVDDVSNKCSITCAINKQSNVIFKHNDDHVDGNGIVMNAVPGVENSSWLLPNSLLDFMIFERFDNYYYYSPTSTFNYISKTKDIKIRASEYIKEFMHNGFDVSQNAIFDDIDVLFGLKDTSVNAPETLNKALNKEIETTAKQEETVTDEIEEPDNRTNIVNIAKRISNSDKNKQIKRKRTVKIKNHSHDTTNEISFADQRRSLY